MSDANTSTETSPYLAYYGMTREPFAPGIEDDLFYPEPTRKQRLEILLHLTQYGNELMLVTGPQGSGKTTLLQQFKRQAMDNWSIARIEAKGGIDERQLLQQLFHQLNQEFQGASKNDLYENLQHHYDALQRSARQGVIVIDDAEQLNITTLKNILAMAALKNADDKPILRVILLGTEELKELFKDAQLGYLASIPQRVIDLPPFDRDQTTHYVLQRLSAANFSAPKPFTHAVLNKLYKHSEGQPQRINELAHEVLINSLPAKFKKDEDNIKLPTTFRPLRLVALILTIGIITALLVFQDQVNTLINPKETTQVPLALPAQQEIPLVETPMAEDFTSEQAPDAMTNPAQAIADSNEIAEPETVPAIEIPEQIVLLENQAELISKTQPEVVEASPTAVADEAQAPSLESAPIQAATAETEPETNTTPTTDQDIASIAVPDIKAVESQTPEIKIPETVIPEPAVQELQTSAASSEEPQRAETTSAPVLPKEKAAPPQAPVAKPKPKTVNPSLDLPIHQDTWLLEQNPAHYTMQMVAGNNIETIRRFIREHQLTDNLALYQSTRKDKPWFGLVYGIYADKQQAINARSRLPESLRSLKPWIRTVGSIQTSLKKPVN